MTTAVVGVISLAHVSVAAVIVGTGIRTVAFAEVQRAADAGALAGAAALLGSPYDPGSAAAEAIRFARLNRVIGRTPEVRPEDVEVDVDAGSVRVRVRATVYAIPNAWAWILGVEKVSVSAVAAAEARAADRWGQRTLKRLKLIE